MRNVLMAFVAVLTGCTMTGTATETERAICDVWRENLPTRSQSDTDQTQAEVGRNRAAYRAACE